MTEIQDRAEVRDAHRLKALAHPLRVQLFDLIAEHDELTATACADLTGESPANCSFHLRTLARYGYIERGDARGKERPWRLTARSWDMRPDPEQPASLAAMQELSAIGLQNEFARVRAFYSQIDREPDAWMQASTFVRSSFWATADELAELSRDLQAITERFAGRSADPSLRPEGARQSRLLAIANPDPQPGRDRVVPVRNA